MGLRKIKEKSRALAAHLLEAAEADIEYEDGKFFVRGSPDQSRSIQDIALMANVAWNMPEGMEPGLGGFGLLRPSQLRLSLWRPRGGLSRWTRITGWWS